MTITNKTIKKIVTTNVKKVETKLLHFENPKEEHHALVLIQYEQLNKQLQF